MVPGTFTINGVSCRVGAFGSASFWSSRNCGWRLGGPPSPYIEWNYWQASNTTYGGEYLMSWDNGVIDGGFFSGNEDAYCVLEGGKTVSSVYGGAVLYGSGDIVGTTTDGISATITLSTGSCGGIASSQPFRSPNATWTSIGFSGDFYAAPGNLPNPNFSKASVTIAGYTGYRPSITANRAGVVHVTADSVSQDCIFQIFRNATSVYSYGTANCNNAGDNAPAALSTTFSVSAGDVITLGDPTDFHNITNIAIWWTAT